MRLFRSILVTFFCALGILLVGYLGVIYGGEHILELAEEPEPVTLEGNSSNVFYASLEDDIQLYPWNYYDPEETRGPIPLDGYEPYLENEILYTLIALAADVDVAEVIHWYGQQETTILDNMVQGNDEGYLLNVYFYEDEIRLNGRTYLVRISCGQYGINSFSCNRIREEDARDSVEWKENSERLTSWLEENPVAVDKTYIETMELLYSYYDRWFPENWYRYNEIFYMYQVLFQYAAMDETPRLGVWDYNNNTSYDIEKYPGEVSGIYPIQMVEMKDSLLLLVEADITVGLYYDVLEQRVTGFHFFQ